MRDQEKICREEWFANHVATYLSDSTNTAEHPVIIINWQKPGRWDYGCRFIIHANWLTVIGDLGEAVYQWGERLTPEFLAKLNFDYFMGKCVASEVGRPFTAFDVSRIYAFKEGMTPAEVAFVEEDISAGMCKGDVESAITAAIDGERITMDFASSVLDWGTIPHPRCVGHWVGLKMALKDLLNPRTAEKYSNERPINTTNEQQETRPPTT